MPGDKFCPSCGEAIVLKQIDGRDRRYCPACDTVHWKNPKPVAWTLVYTPDAVVLMQRAHAPDQGTWSIPGGFLEHDESFAAAASRELREETGVTASPEDLDLFDTLTLSRGDASVVGVVFHTRQSVTASDVSAGEEAQDARLWTFDEIADQENIRPACRPLLEQLHEQVR